MRSQIITILPNTHSRNLKPCESQRHSLIDCVLKKKFGSRNVRKDFVVNFNQLYRLCILTLTKDLRPDFVVFQETSAAMWLQI